MILNNILTLCKSNPSTPTLDQARILDTILIILLAKGQLDNNSLNLELRRCSCFVTMPELKTLLQKLKDDGMITGVTNQALN